MVDVIAKIIIVNENKYDLLLFPYSAKWKNISALTSQFTPFYGYKHYRKYNTCTAKVSNIHAVRNCR